MYVSQRLGVGLFEGKVKDVRLMAVASASGDLV